MISALLAKYPALRRVGLHSTWTNQIYKEKHLSIFPLFQEKQTVTQMSLATPIFEQNLEDTETTFPDPLKTTHVRQNIKNKQLPVTVGMGFLVWYGIPRFTWRYLIFWEKAASFRLIHILLFCPILPFYLWLSLIFTDSTVFSKHSYWIQYEEQTVHHKNIFQTHTLYNSTCKSQQRPRSSQFLGNIKAFIILPI